MVILETTRAEYLSISGIEVYSARCSGNGCGSVGISRMMKSTRTTRTSMNRGMIPMGGRSFKRGMIPMGGMSMKGMSGPPTFRMTNTKAQLIKPDQGTKYHAHAYGAAVAL